jgi:tRNA dimethylallyltransferase
MRTARPLAFMRPPKSEPPRCLCIAGPTASGKSALAMEVARRRKVELISVDSALVYRGMDIGTAKPSAAELAAVPHHLIDILDPAQSYSAAEFVRDATRLMEEIKARGALPVLVGGTMLYFKALFDGLDDMPAANPALRAAIDAEAQERGWPAMHAELARVDAPTAARLSPNDSQRIQRALEVYRASGRALSSFHSATKNIAAHAGISPANALISLEPTDRAWLHQRIAQRFDAMLAAGLLDEVRALKARGDLHPDLPSMRCVGYRQAWDALEKISVRAGPVEAIMNEFRERSIAATRQLAKRQITWLRSMPERRVAACDGPTAQADALALVDSLL